jgi:hypothetical protein
MLASCILNTVCFAHTQVDHEIEPIIIEDLQHAPPLSATQDHQLLDEYLISIKSKTAHPVSTGLFTCHGTTASLINI